MSEGHHCALVWSTRADVITASEIAEVSPSAAMSAGSYHHRAEWSRGSQGGWKTTKGDSGVGLLAEVV